jgi:hypothetical protein
LVLGRLAGAYPEHRVVLEQLAANSSRADHKQLGVLQFVDNLLSKHNP